MICGLTGRPGRVRVVRGRGRLPAEHITLTEVIAMNTCREFFERPRIGTGRRHPVAATTRRKLEA
jgi:hypothetical protein